ncbi:MAG: hypothetical protein JNL50_00480 [Phycisphaerae bacterium]|nr:hypothetical protein [Phycisphaerae bacterium]
MHVVVEVVGVERRSGRRSGRHGAWLAGRALARALALVGAGRLVARCLIARTTFALALVALT